MIPDPDHRGQLRDGMRFVRNRLYSDTAPSTGGVPVGRKVAGTRNAAEEWNQ